MSDGQHPTDSNPLSVDEAKSLIDKWESHPGLIMAILDAARKLKDELVKLERDYDCVAAENQLLRDDNSNLKDNVNAVLLTARNNAKKLIADNKVLQTELEQLRDELQRSQDWSNAVASELQTTHRKNDQLIELARYLSEERKNELDQLRAVVAQNNASLSSIVLRWIQPSKN